MAEDTFQKVIEVEKEIRINISRERQRVDRWLEGIKAELEERYRGELKSLKEEAQRKRRERKTRSEDRKDRLLSEAREKAEALESLSDEELRKILRELLRDVLPGDGS